MSVILSTLLFPFLQDSGDIKNINEGIVNSICSWIENVLEKNIGDDSGIFEESKKANDLFSKEDEEKFKIYANKFSCERIPTSLVPVLYLSSLGMYLLIDWLILNY